MGEWRGIRKRRGGRGAGVVGRGSKKSVGGE